MMTLRERKTNWRKALEAERPQGRTFGTRATADAGLAARAARSRHRLRRLLAARAPYAVILREVRLRRRLVRRRRQMNGNGLTR